MDVIVPSLNLLLQAFRYISLAFPDLDTMIANVTSS